MTKLTFLVLEELNNQNMTENVWFKFSVLPDILLTNLVTLKVKHLEIIVLF